MPLPKLNGLEDKFFDLYPPAPLVYVKPPEGFGFKLDPLTKIVLPAITKFQGLFSNVPKPKVKDLAAPI
jgi:hypothetical protein